ncbi:MAG: SOS response-associated peptidase [Pikeienuella sp.]
MLCWPGDARTLVFTPLPHRGFLTYRLLMCGRFAFTLPHEAMTQAFGVKPDPMLVGRGPRYNICPTQEVEAILSDGGDREGRRVARLRWGFIPHWYKTPNDGPLLINARGETLAQKPAFGKAARETRCLIPASGFYEWRQSAGKGREPYWITPADGSDMLAWAGVWREWEDGAGQRLSTCAIVTVGANGPLSPIHHRAPLVIDEGDWGLWLGEEGHGAAQLMHPAADDFFAFHRVSPTINKAKADGPELMAEVIGDVIDDDGPGQGTRDKDKGFGTLL